MRGIYMIIGMMATLGLNVSAVALRIYTPVHRNLIIVTLTPEWTIDRRTKNDFLRNPDTAFGHIQQPRGGNNFFAVTGLMEWGTQNFSEKRAFWVTSDDFVGEPFKADPYSPAQGVIRAWLKVRQVQYQPMITSVSPLIWISAPCVPPNAYLVPKDMPEEASWADTAKKEKLDDHWLKCYPPAGKSIGDYFKMPDGST